MAVTVHNIVVSILISCTRSKIDVSLRNIITAVNLFP